MRLLRDALADWTDWDVAAFELGHALGVFEDRTFLDVKHVFWTSNSLGGGLHTSLHALVAAGVLEHRDEGDDQYRWAVPPPDPARGD